MNIINNDAKLSVVICTYNPIDKIFKTCLDSIAEAMIHTPIRELVIIDNNSTKPLSEVAYVSDFVLKFPNVRIIVEKEQGLTPARLRGITETTGPLLLYIDDDNFIPLDFFATGISVAGAHPHIGAFSGQVKLVFEKNPEAWTERYWGLLVHREFQNDVWSNFPHMPETMPCGAGLFVRRNVAEYYLKLHKEGRRKIKLDRSGKSLFSGGDNDLSACACDVGMGVGLFHSLTLNHYIPENRVSKEYLLKLAEGIAASSVVFKSFRGEMPKSKSIKNKLAYLLRKQLKKGVDRAFFDAVEKGELEGIKMVKL